jgi:stearoyl-CoA desaturase (Delta-9 desaturase)
LLVPQRINGHAACGKFKIAQRAEMLALEPFLKISQLCRRSPCAEMRPDRPTNADPRRVPAESTCGNFGASTISTGRKTAVPEKERLDAAPAEAGNAHDEFMYPSAIPFALVHLTCIAALWTGVTWQAAALCMGLYWLRIFGIGAGYHRYFAHRAYSTGRAFQLVLALLSQSTAQKSVLWWAAKHRHHHLFSDTERDVHSPRHRGFIYSHLGWIFAREHDRVDLTKVADLARYPELMWLHRHELVPATVLALLCFALAGWPGLVVGFFWSTMLVYHATFCINSLAHVHGKKRYVTGDDSRNNWLLAIFTMGEGWHNNHHAYQSSARQGFCWWEVDLTFYILRLLSLTGLVWDLKTPPAAVLRNEHRLGSRVVDRAARRLAESFNADLIAGSIRSALCAPSLSAVQERLAATQLRAADVLAGLSLPHLPTRTDILSRAMMMYARTPSIDDIVDRAHALLLDAIGLRLRGAVI